MAEEGTKRLGRNEPCHCGSGKKYKHCCLAKDEEAEWALLEEQAKAAQPPTPPEDEPPPRRTPPPRATGQPWRGAAGGVRGARRVTTPRKAG
jgi:hypothetical protein